MKVSKVLEVRKAGIKIKSVRKTKSAAIVVETESTADLDKIRADAKLAEAESEVVVPRRRRPKLILLNVGRGLSEDDIGGCVFGQNDLAGRLSKAEFKGS